MGQHADKHGGPHHEPEQMELRGVTEIRRRPPDNSGWQAMVHPSVDRQETEHAPEAVPNSEEGQDRRPKVELEG